MRYRNIIIKSSFILSWGICALIVFFSSFENQVFVPKAMQSNFRKIFPEGWGFFTKSPRSLIMEVYTIDQKKLTLMDMSTNSLENFLGFSRTSRIKSYEASVIASQVSKKNWIKSKTLNIRDHLCDSIIQVNLEKDLKYFNPGVYMFKLYKPIPFAWANHNQEKFNPFSVIKIQIQ